MKSNLKIKAHFQSEKINDAVTALNELNCFYKESESQLNQLPKKITIKNVIRVLQRASQSPRLIKKLQTKLNVLDNDTIDILGLESQHQPSLEKIRERIQILQSYRKLRNNELKRYHCGCLKLLYLNFGKEPNNRFALRDFVVDALSFAGIDFPDPSNHADLLDAWIETTVEKISIITHEKAAQQSTK